MPRFTLLLLIVVLVSCGPKETAEEKSFREIVEGFPLVKLPLEVDENDSTALLYSSLKSELAKNYSDKLLKELYINFWGRIYPSDNFHYLIGTIWAEHSGPVIYVFDKKGTLVEQHSVLSQFPVGPDGYGTAIGLIRPDKTLKGIDSLFYHTYNEETGTDVPGTGVCTAVVTEYKIGDDGKVIKVSSDSVKTKIPD